VGIPRAIGTVFERQVRRLDPATRAALDLAAVLGRRLTDLPLYQAVGLSSAAAAEALSRLQQDEGFLREVGGELEFRNELIRAQAYYAVAGKARQHLHRQVALLLAKEVPGGGGGSDGPSKLEVAWHFLRAGDPQGAASYALEGAETAVAVGGPHEAEQILEALLGSALDQATERRARLVLARALLEQSKAQAAVPLLRILREDSALEPMQQAEVRGLFAKALYLANDSGACEAAGEALHSAREMGDLALIARALFEYARTGIEEGRSERVEAAAAECDRLLQLPGGSQESMIFYAKAFCDYYSFEVERAEGSLLTAISLLGDSAQPVRQSQFYTGLGVCRLAKLEPHAALEACTKAVEFASKVGDDSRMSLINNAMCAAEGVRGDFVKAIQHALESIALGRRALNQPSLVNAYLNLAELYALTGDTEKETGAFDSAEALLSKGQTWWTRVDFALHSASSALIHGNISLALECVAEAEKLASGRESAAQDAGVLQKFRAFRSFHEQGPEEALSIAHEAMGWFRGRNHLYYYTALAVSAWTERMMEGDYSSETAQELQSFDHRPIRGRKALFVAQGFLNS
jgi:tetratricopeptide (TPR) repeat protein